MLPRLILIVAVLILIVALYSADSALLTAPTVGYRRPDRTRCFQRNRPPALIRRGSF